MWRFGYLAFFLTLLVFLSVFFLLYLYQDSYYFTKSFQPWLKKEAPPFAQALENLRRGFQKIALNPLHGIGGIIGILVVFGTISGILHRKNAPKKESSRSMKRLFLLVFLAILLSIGGFATIYFWPSDELILGNFKIKRGTPQHFLQQSLDIGFVVAIAHLFLFLCVSVAYVLFWKEKVSRSREGGKK
jgi:hypothetical protein